MQATVSRWGNSLAIRLPKVVVSRLQRHEGDPVDLVLEGESVVIRARRPHSTLEELVVAMRPEHAPETLDDAAAPPVGDELLGTSWPSARSGGRSNPRRSAAMDAVRRPAPHGAFVGRGSLLEGRASG
jgi:antitoxin MazE